MVKALLSTYIFMDNQTISIVSNPAVISFNPQFRNSVICIKRKRRIKKKEKNKEFDQTADLSKENSSCDINTRVVDELTLSSMETA